MELIADLHLHSRFSRAVSKKMDLSEIASWAARKGIGLVATGDWTHPVWFAEIESQLEEVSPGIFALKEGSEAVRKVRFLLSTEISTIYKQGGKARRVHSLIFSPSFLTCRNITQALLDRGANLSSDGRPIIGLSAKELLQLTIEVDPDSFFVPAHIWTPWFSVFGSKSGFSSLEECFEELAPGIRVIETGLSSDPRMNWQVEELHSRAIMSSSDAHSGPKLGREATVFVGPYRNFSFQDIISALKQESKTWQIGYTIEFFPEEGKYHWTGHRACDVVHSPEQDRVEGIICPVCGRSLTVGVEHRVEELATHLIAPQELSAISNKDDVTFLHHPKKDRPPFVSLVPLLELLQQVRHSKTKAEREYEALVSSSLTEFDLLLYLPESTLIEKAGPEVAAAIMHVRRRQVKVDPGYDGVFGKVVV